MKHLKCVLIVLLSLWILACDKDASDSFISTNLPNNSLILSGAGDTKSFTLKSSFSWEITEKPNWISINNMKGSGGTNSIEVSVQPNNTAATRSGHITILSGDGSEITIQVSQQRFLTLSPLSAIVPATGAATNVGINIGTDWTVSWTTPWIISATPNGPSGAQTIQVNCTPNTMGPRTANLSFTAGDGQVIMLALTQQAPAFAVTSTSELSGNGGTNIVSVIANGAWTNITAYDNAIITNITPKSGNGGQTNLTITCAKNTTGARNLSLTFVAPDGQTAAITLNQALASVYEVGEYYPNATNPVGIVFETSNNGASGKMVSLTEAAGLAWCNRGLDDMFEGYFAGASSTVDGLANRNAIKAFISPSAAPNVDRDWTNYQIFYWVTLFMNNDNVDGSWYIPAKDELLALAAWFHTSSANNNAKFEAKGGHAIHDIDPSYYYSSTGSWDYENRHLAWYVNMRDQAAGRVAVTTFSAGYNVRAIAKF